MGKGALRPFFKGHSLKKEKEHEKKEEDKMLSHFVTLPFFCCRTESDQAASRLRKTAVTTRSN